MWAKSVLILLVTFEGLTKALAYLPSRTDRDAAGLAGPAGGGRIGGKGSGPAAGGGGLRPQFLGSVPNITVAVGRDAKLPCVVKNLQDYKVAFVHLERQMILTIHNHVITRIPRFEITHDKHHTWNLYIRNVQKEDKGYYMCQINTDPMLSNVGYVDVVVPPNILDKESSPSTMSVRETHNASLICKADGTPQPQIKWQREDKKPIIIKRKKKEGKKEKHMVHGEVLDLIRISRTEMGAYLCIAQNGVPPSVSKRIILVVEFAPMIWIPNQLVGAPLGTDVKLECHTESSPKAIAYWSFNDNMVLDSDRFKSDERSHSEYKLDATLTIRNLKEEDFGSYRCISKNSLGESDGTIMLYQLETVTEEIEEEVIEEVEYDYNVPAANDEAEEEDDEDVDEDDNEIVDVDDQSEKRKKNKERRQKERKQNRKTSRRRKQDDNPTYWHQNSSASALLPSAFCILFAHFIIRED